MKRPDSRELELLRAHVLGRDRTWIIAHPESRLTLSQKRRLHNATRRFRNGTPLAYLIGRRDFYGRDFAVRPGVLIPRPETEHLVETALERLPRNRPFVIADVGTGSGCIGITLALERPDISVIATDRSDLAVKTAVQNASRFHFGKRFSVFRGSLLAPLQRRGIRPDMIVANLPYLKPNEISRVRREPRLALIGGPDGLRIYRQFFDQLQRYRWTVPTVLEIDPRRTRAVVRIAKRVWPNAKTTVRRDLAGRKRILVVDPPIGTRPTGSTE